MTAVSTEQSTAQSTAQSTSRITEQNTAPSAPVPVAAPAPVEIKPLPNWYFPIVGTFAGVFDIARAYPVAYWLIPVVAVLNLTLSLTVLRTRMRFMRALWKNKRTRLLAVGLVALRFAVRGALGLAGFAVGAAAGSVLIGVVMAVLGTAMAWGDQWLILRTLERSRTQGA
ncbi:MULTISPECIES: hypothetical protein [unclassified Streptomyces]|uniref:hypothetical protein n=1 Tax=unclassified Streptomyces TaxID=2593676 RepID=UPI002E13B44E|nr:hypothetical protein OG452_10730 [Streptomyces sp. NBC_01197]WSS51548.1 hypothetical protein OG708_24650 [Streptomyces sp. NBC_01180]